MEFLYGGCFVVLMWTGWSLFRGRRGGGASSPVTYPISGVPGNVTWRIQRQPPMDDALTEEGDASKSPALEVIRCLSLFQLQYFRTR